MLQTISHASTTVGATSYDPVSATNISVLSDDELCLSQRNWWIFIMSSTVTFYSGLVAILLWRGCAFLCCHKEPEKNSSSDTQNKKQITDSKASDKGKCQHQAKITGNILAVLVLVLNIASFILYLIDISNHKYVEWCISLSENIIQQIDLGFNMFFMVFFFIRFVAASDKLWFMFDMYSLIDFYTIPPFIVSLYLRQSLIGFRFIRVMYIMTIPDLFSNLNILKTSNSIYRWTITTTIASAIVLAAGAIHLVENYGDPMDFENAQLLSYWTCIFIAIIPPLGFKWCNTVLATFVLVLYLPNYLSKYPPRPNFG